MRGIKKAKISDQVSNYIRDLIMQDELHDGDRIVESQIARELGISQAPVREAIRKLEGMGFVEIQPFVGCFVRSIDADRLDQAYALRSLLECFAAETSVHAATEKDLRQMEELLEQMRIDARENDREALIDHDVRFHQVMITLTHNSMLKGMWETACVPQWSNLTISASGDLEYFAESHALIYEYMKNKEFAALQQELKKHFQTASEIAKRTLEAKNRNKE